MFVRKTPSGPAVLNLGAPRRERRHRSRRQRVGLDHSETPAGDSADSAARMTTDSSTASSAVHPLHTTTAANVTGG